MRTTRLTSASRAAIAVASAVLLLGACASNSTGSAGATEATQPDGESELIETTDLDIAGNWTLSADDAITLDVTSEGQASGTGGCNRYTTTIGRDPATGNLVVGPVASTMMACDQKIMDAEAAYFEQLQSVIQGAVDGSDLVLETLDGDQLTFAPAK